MIKSSHRSNNRLMSNLDQFNETDRLTNPCICSGQEQNQCPAKKLRRQPDWIKILTCPTIWSLIAVRIADDWTRQVRTLLPTFLSNLVHLDASTVGQLVGLQMACGAVIGTILVYAFRKYASVGPFRLSLTSYRKTITSLYLSTMAIGILSTIVWDCDVWTQIYVAVSMPLIIFFNAIGPQQVPLDLSVTDSGLIMSAVHLASLVAIAALPLSSWILSQSADSNPSAHMKSAAGDRAAWRVIWAINIAFTAVALIWCLLFCKTDQKSYSHLKPIGKCQSRLRLDEEDGEEASK